MFVRSLYTGIRYNGGNNLFSVHTALSTQSRKFFLDFPDALHLVAIIQFFPQEKLEQREINIQMNSRRFSEGIFFLLICDHKLKKIETWGLLLEQEMKLKVFLDS
jgi:hypothetical protein